MRQRRGQAVVIGASMSGLLAARVLAGVYDEVTLVERDTIPPPGEARPGVPQGRHVHGLLARGLQILEGLFPGLTEELIDQGALQGDGTAGVRWFLEGGYHCRVESGIRGLLVSRPCLEAHVHRRLLALPSVRVRTGCAVTGLVASADGTRITGVRLRERAAHARTETVLPADLVVDASGRSSRAPVWLAALGYPAPAEERIMVNVGYTSRRYRRTAQHLDGDVGAIVTAAPDSGQLRGAAVLAQEGGQWLVTLAGYFGDHAPATEAGFRAFAQSLGTADVFDLITVAEPLSDFATYTYAAYQRRRYERLARFPHRFLVTGDALCSFNPLYAQGMTVAALEAVVLRNSLGTGERDLPRRFFRRASRVVDVPWQMAVGADLRIPAVAGRRTPLLRGVNWYLAKLQLAAQRDPVVTVAFHRVTNLLSPPASLLQPRIALRVLGAHLRRTRPVGGSGPRRAPLPTQR